MHNRSCPALWVGLVLIQLSRRPAAYHKIQPRCYPSCGATAAAMAMATEMHAGCACHRWLGKEQRTRFGRRARKSNWARRVKSNSPREMGAGADRSQSCCMEGHELGPVNKKYGVCTCVSYGWRCRDHGESFSLLSSACTKPDMQRLLSWTEKPPINPETM